MRVAVDISLYPLDREFIPPIKDVIERLNQHDGLEVWTNAMSTQVVGEFDDIAFQQWSDDKFGTIIDGGCIRGGGTALGIYVIDAHSLPIIESRRGGEIGAEETILNGATSRCGAA